MVRRLELAREDLERLGESCRSWSLVAEPIAPPTRPRTSEAEANGDGEPVVDPILPPLLETPGPDSEEDLASLDRAAAEALQDQARQADRLAGRVRSEWREKLLTLRMIALLGPRGAAVLENTILILIPALIGLIAVEWLLERAGPLSVLQHEVFAWADLAVCSVLLLEVAVRISMAPERGFYLVRHLLIDLVPSLPFGFVMHQFELAEMGVGVGASDSLGLLGWLASTGRMFQVLRTFRLILPIVRLARIALILLRLSDRLVRRLAGMLNRNIVLFEPSSAQRPESRDRHRLLALRGELDEASRSIEDRLGDDDLRELAERLLGDFEARIRRLPAPSTVAADAGTDVEEREIPVEAVVERLIQMTPERLVDRMGPSFVQAVDRYLRLFDVPILRRLPGIRNLLVYREKSPSEAVALAANYLGHLIQQALDVAYFLADLQGTLSPPVFLDRLGATIVNATRTPARRLLYLGSAFLVLFLLVQALPVPAAVREAIDKVQNLLGWPVIILGVICLGFWSLGAWFRKIANQSADFCERVVEAQFAAHTKNLKSRRERQDAIFLRDRVIDPELRLRSSDDRVAVPIAPDEDEGRPSASPGSRFLFEDREMAFLRNVKLLYQDYLDGSPFHRSDTKASIQLLGNLALANLRRSHLRHLLRESRMLDRLDMNRAGGLFGGPYLWFNYITRLLVQETALLILDYNRHAIPIDRLACSPESDREAFRTWLSNRLRIEPEEVWLPETPTPIAGGSSFDDAKIRPRRDELSSRPEAKAFLETVEFTSVDFLADDPDRDVEIRDRFGPQVAELVRRDREQNVRRAFRSFPLHELPVSSRTINPFALYEAYFAGGRVALLPFRIIVAALRGVMMGFRAVYDVVDEILHPRVDRNRSFPPDTYWAALRKIHRMRKPVFMGSLWLRAQFDVEYLGLPLPTAPSEVAIDSTMEADLDYIGATRRDRIIAEQLRQRHQARLEWVGRWLRRFGWSFDGLPGYLADEIPYLANRGGEALRAAVAACILDHDDIATLALSIEGLARVMEYAVDPANDPKRLPPHLPEPVVNVRTLWHPVHRIRRKPSGLFELPCFPRYNETQRRRIVQYLRRHRRVVRGWIRVVLGQGGPDPWETVRVRLRDVLLRTDLWSDQILVLRAVQSLTMLDVQHNCELVWSLGGYTTTSETGFPGSGPASNPDAEAIRPGIPPVPLSGA